MRLPCTLFFIAPCLIQHRGQPPCPRALGEPCRLALLWPAAPCFFCALSSFSHQVQSSKANGSPALTLMPSRCLPSPFPSPQSRSSSTARCISTISLLSESMHQLPCSPVFVPQKRHPPACRPAARPSPRCLSTAFRLLTCTNTPAPLPLLPPPKQVIFHLQTRSPPVLPPLCELFAGPYSQDAPRPAEAGAQPDFALLQASRAARGAGGAGRGGAGRGGAGRACCDAGG